MVRQTRIDYPEAYHHIDKETIYIIWIVLKGSKIMNIQ